MGRWHQGTWSGAFKSPLRHQVTWFSCGRNVVSVKPHQYRIGRGAVLWRANLAARSLKGKDLAGAYLTWAYLGDADLSNANLVGAYLTGATLTCTNLKNANLSDADFSGANLWGADLAGADLSGTNFGGSFGDANTRWPEDFDPEAAGVIIKWSF